MSELIASTQISPPVRMRNEHWQRRFSEDFALIEKLLEFAVEPDGAESLLNEVYEAFEVPIPEFAFNRRRKAHNGLYEPPRNHKLMWSGGERLAALEKERGKPFSEAGVVRSWLKPDVIAAATVWALLVPQSLAYAQLGGLSAVYGLYAALCALVLYPLFGSSRHLNVGPEAKRV